MERYTFTFFVLEDYNQWLSLIWLDQRVTFTPSPTDVASAIFSSELPKSDSLFRLQRHGENSQLDKGEHISVYLYVTIINSCRLC